MNEWMNEWIEFLVQMKIRIKWMNKWMKQWYDKWIYERMNEPEGVSGLEDPFPLIFIPSQASLYKISSSEE